MGSKRYAIISLNDISGLVKGYYGNLNHVYYQGPVDDEGRHEWTDSLRGAMLFETEEAAWDYLEETWGSVLRCNAVISIHPDYDVDTYEPNPGEAGENRRREAIRAWSGLRIDR